MTRRNLQFSVIAAAASVGLLFAKVTTDYNHAADLRGSFLPTFCRERCALFPWPRQPHPRRMERKNARNLLQRFRRRLVLAPRGRHDVENTPVGTLVVDVFDGQNKKLIWRGTATDVLSDKPEKNEKKLETEVAGLSCTAANWWGRLQPARGFSPARGGPKAAADSPLTTRPNPVRTY
jgi:hypothetical protein